MGMMALVLYWLPSGHFVGDGFTYAMIAALIGWIGCQIDSLLGALLENRGFMTKGTVNAALNHHRCGLDVLHPRFVLVLTDDSVGVINPCVFP